MQYTVDNGRNCNAQFFIFLSLYRYRYIKAIVSDPIDWDSMWTVDPEMDVLSGGLEASLEARKAFMEIK